MSFLYKLKMRAKGEGKAYLVISPSPLFFGLRQGFTL